jgi:hypothetical protein
MCTLSRVLLCNGFVSGIHEDDSAAVCGDMFSSDLIIFASNCGAAAARVTAIVLAVFGLLVIFRLNAQN